MEKEELIIKIEKKKTEAELLYRELGQKYYDKHKMEKTSEFEAEMKALNDINEELEELDYELNPPEPIRFEVDPKAKFDPITGQPVESFSSIHTENWVCLNCGKEMFGLAKFCQYCGTRRIVVEPVVVNEPNSDKEQTVEESPDEYCGECGSKIRPGMKFCPNCRAELI